MAIGERIRFIRNLRGMTQKWLGQAVGFPQKTADIRMAQYESGSRTPKDDLVKSLADVLEVSPLALKVPDIDSDLGFIHTLFAIEDIHGIRVEKQGEEIHIVFDGSILLDRTACCLEKAKVPGRYFYGISQKKAYIWIRSDVRNRHRLQLEDDVNIADAKPDVYQVVTQQGHVELEEVRASDGHVHVKGVLHFKVLYLADEERTIRHAWRGSWRLRNRF